jgi:endonuclease V-like protein UPF0215 family
LIFRLPPFFAVVFKFQLQSYTHLGLHILSAVKDFGVVKPEVRVLGVDDGKFNPRSKGTALIVGVVFRGGQWIEGVMHTDIAIDGLDATENLTQMICASPHHRQLRLIMLNGVTFGGFNVVNIEKLNQDTGLPVIALTRDKPDLESILQALKHLPDFEERWRIMMKSGEIHEIAVKGTKLYMEHSGISLTDAYAVVELTATRSCFPEPLRVAHLIASGVTP